MARTTGYFQPGSPRSEVEKQRHVVVRALLHRLQVELWVDVEVPRVAVVKYQRNYRRLRQNTTDSQLHHGGAKIYGLE